MKVDGHDRETRDGMLTIRIAGDPPEPTLALSGELDMANAATFSAELERLETEGTGTITIDMAGLEFIDSTGIAVLVAAHRRLNGGSERLHLIPSRASAVRRVMEVTGLDRELPFAGA